MLFIDEYDRATPSARAQLSQLIQEQTYGQLFTVALCHPGIGRGLYDRRVFTLNFEIL